MAKNSGLQIGVLGAGIAGLTAGLELSRAGYQVLIFEARTRTGGRIQTINLNEILIESGPEFIHGHLKETINLLIRYNIRYDPINGKIYSYKDGFLRETYDMAEGWERLLEKMKSLKDDLPFNEFLENYFPGEDSESLRTSAKRYAEGFDLADIQRASTKALLVEWENEQSEQYRIPSGYGTLISSMEDEFRKGGGKIFLNHRVKEVDWQGRDIQIRIDGDQTFSIHKLIVSVPISMLHRNVLSSEAIEFLPSLGKKQFAFNEIGYGSVVKIKMIWDSPFWNRLIPDAQFIFSDFFIPTWWTQYPLDVPMLTGWIGGKNAEAFADKPDDFFLDKAIGTLSGIFSISESEIKKGLKAYRIFNWKNEPWSRGAYSYSLVGSGKAKAICREPVADRIYFAGEAYYEGPCPGTVEAAVVTGLDAARQLMGGIK